MDLESLLRLTPSNMAQWFPERILQIERTNCESSPPGLERRFGSFWLRRGDMAKPPWSGTFLRPCKSRDFWLPMLTSIAPRLRPVHWFVQESPDYIFRLERKSSTEKEFSPECSLWPTNVCTLVKPLFPCITPETFDTAHRDGIVNSRKWGNSSMRCPPSLYYNCFAPLNSLTPGFRL